jgi:hypothetical protein
VTGNLPRPALTQWLTKVDFDVDKNNQHVIRIHELANKYPELTVVPAHDPLVYRALPHFPVFSK